MGPSIKEVHKKWQFFNRPPLTFTKINNESIVEKEQNPQTLDIF